MILHMILCLLSVVALLVMVTNPGHILTDHPHLKLVLASIWIAQLISAFVNHQWPFTFLGRV